jgi:hypothetical protein
LAAVLRTPERVNLLQTAFPNDYDFLIGVAEPKFREFVIAKTQNNFQA